MADINNIYNHYNNIIKENDFSVKKLSKKIYTLGTIRLILVAGAIITILLWPEPGWKISGLIALAYFIPFLVLMIWCGRLSERKTYANTLIKLCRDEISALNYDFSAFDGAPEKISASHSFSLDLDLFGEQSLFQSFNRTVTLEGKKQLCDWILNPLTDKIQIKTRQNAIRELSGLTSLRQHFYVTGSVKKRTTNNIETLELLIGSETKLTQNPFWKIIIWIIPILWVLFFLLYLTIAIPSIITFSFTLACIILANCKIKYVNKLHADVNKMDEILSVYSNLISIIEDSVFQSDDLNKIKKQYEETSGIKASVAIKELSKQMHSLDQRGNIFTIVFNIFSLRDIRTVLKIEQWKITHKNYIRNWFNALGDFDALLSLGGFAFNHPSYIYPEIMDHYFIMNGKELGHPLLHRDICVRNNISINKSPQFMIVTGANMAGKSTYLRTIGVNYLLSCIGAPAFAKELSVYPASLMTSLRTSDSLVANESYFYAELKRLKTIINRLDSGEKLFIILDEILKGTNSEDKQKGSLALIRQFISYKTCGIIATHDLILGTLHNEFPEYVSNYRFEADIKDDKLSFSYKLQEGVAENLNACFLMKKMGITI